MKKRAIWIIFCVILSLFAVVLTDFYRVSRFELPFFCVLAHGEDDGGSGIYRGVGYSFDIEGNFMPEDEFPGVTKYRAYLLGMEIMDGIRD